MLTAPRAIACAALLALVACEGNVGTVRLSIVTAPDSEVMDAVVRARLTLSDPPAVIETERNAEGQLLLDLEVTAEGQTGTVSFEGFDAGGDLVAYGTSGQLPVASVDADVALYVAAPRSLAEAPVALDPPRSELGATPMSFGVLVAGGRDATGAVVDDVAIYNVYSHELQLGDDLPSPRAAPTVMLGSFGVVYIFGGTDSAGEPTGTLWRFDTDVPPVGAYQTLTAEAGLARAGADSALLGQEAHVVVGDPLVVVDGVAGRARAFSNAPALTAPAASVSVAGVVVTLFAGIGAGDTGATTLTQGSFESIEAPAAVLRTGHAVVLTADADILLVGGADDTGTPLASAVRWDAVGGGFTVIDDLLATPRTGAAIAASDDYLVVAGGIDAGGELVPTAEAFDARTLEPVATAPMVVPRRDATAVALGNGQVVIAGGTGADGAPVGTIELFTGAP